jgi:hypothetical protein
MQKSGFGEMTPPRLGNYTFMMQPSKALLPTQLYEIRVHEDLDDELAAWFSPLTVDHAPNGATTLTVPVRDQAELHGLLIKIRDLNLTLIAIINK